VHTVKGAVCAGENLYMREPWDVTETNGKSEYVYKYGTDRQPGNYKKAYLMPNEALRIALLVKNVSVKSVLDLTAEELRRAFYWRQIEGDREVRKRFVRYWKNVHGKNNYDLELKPLAWVYEVEASVVENPLAEGSFFPHAGTGRLTEDFINGRN
jgi:hypothetical protein